MATAMDMVTAAKAVVENLTPNDVKRALADREVLLVDIREPTETVDGFIPGATLAPRGMIEFYADKTTPYHMDGFDEDRRIILYCSAGSRSALAARTLQDLGYSNVAHLEGGFKGWKESGGSITSPR